jgi:hypothetical protein
MSIALWDIFEQEFRTRQDIGNPFTEVTLSVDFTNGETRHVIDGFFDGERDGELIWRVRFAPMVKGSWSFRTSSNCKDLDSLQGDFECSEPVSAGGLTVNHQFPNWFFRSDGSAEFIVNDGWTPHPGSKYGIEQYGAQIFSYPTEEQFRVFVEALARHRVNMIVDLKQLYARQKTCTDPSFLWPWKVVEPETHRIDRERLSLEYFQRLDRQIQLARDLGVFYGVEVLYDNSTFRKQEWANHPYNEKNGGWIGDWDKPTDEYTTDQLPFGWGLRRILDLDNSVHMTYLSRMVSYMVARTSAYRNVFYAMGCETSNIYPGQAQRVDDWFAWWGDYMARKDPHGRLLTIGDVGSRDGVPWHEINENSAFVYGNARNNIITTQEHTFTDDVIEYSDAIHKFGLRFWKFRRPMVIGEQDGRNNNKYWKERRGYWVAFVSGFAMGRIDRHYQLSTGDQLGESALFGHEGEPEIYLAMENLASFVDQGDVRFWRMSPSDSLLADASAGVYCLAEEGREYVLYFAQGGTAGVSLPSGTYRIRWYDPRNGEFLPDRVATGVADDAVSLEAPDSEDWAVLIQKTGEV